MRPASAFLVAAAGTAGGFGLLHLQPEPAVPARHYDRQPAVPDPPQHPALPLGAHVVALPQRAIAVYRRPGAPRPERWLAVRTPAGSHRTLLVTGTIGGAWLRVLLPVRPNGGAGWVRARAVALERDDWALRVSLRRHRLTVLRTGRALWSTTIAIGARATPTPTGRFFTTELLRQPDSGGIYGPWVFALSGFSRVITNFRGGRGEIGIHGTNTPQLLGRDVSHGCVRVTNRAITRLAAELPLGTPVTISVR